MRKALVIGGGFAGCAAAWELKRRGWETLLLEKGPTLGGRAGSFHHPKLNQDLDGGQHLFLGVYEHSLSLLRELGTADEIRWQERLSVPFFHSGGVAMFQALPLPGPLGLLGALARFELLDRGERRKALGFGLRAFPGLLRPLSLSKLSAARWLEACGQPPGLIRKFWEPMCLAALNAPSQAAPASMLAAALRRGFLRGGRASALGFPMAPLSRLLEPLKQKLEVRGGCGVERVELGAGGTKVYLDGGEALEADGVVVALPHMLAPKLFDAALAESLGLKAASKMESSPILTAHLFTEKAFLPEPFGVFAPEDAELGFEFHWAFDRSRLFGQRGLAGAHWSCFVASAARQLSGMSQDAILVELKRQLCRRLKSFDPESISMGFVLKEARATPLFRPGEARLPQKTAYKGRLALAGDWTDTGLPATIEGAAYSGVLAAQALDS